MNINNFIKISLVFILFCSLFSCKAYLCSKKNSNIKKVLKVNISKKNTPIKNPYGIRNIYVLGDSLSDQGIFMGEILKIAANKDIKTQLFYNGVIFSNGYPAVKQFAQKLQIPLEIGYKFRDICNKKFKLVGQNYAIASAKSYFPSNKIKLDTKQKRKSKDLHLHGKLKKITQTYLHKSIPINSNYQNVMSDHEKNFEERKFFSHRKTIKKVSNTLKKHKISPILKNHKVAYNNNTKEFIFEKEEKKHFYLIDELKNIIKFYEEINSLRRQVHLRIQYKNFISDHDDLGPKDLVIIIIGGNDIMYAADNNDPSIIKKAINSIYKVVSKLDKKGVHIILGNAPNVGTIPMYTLKKKEKRDLAETFSTKFNEALESKIFNKILNVKKLDLYGILNSMKKHFSNLSRPCISNLIDVSFFEEIEDLFIGYFTGIIPSKKRGEDLDNSIFFDYVHPTKAANEILKNKIEKLVKEFHLEKLAK